MSQQKQPTLGQNENTVTQLPHKGAASRDSRQRVRLCQIRDETVGTNEIDLSENITIVIKFEHRTDIVSSLKVASLIELERFDCHQYCATVRSYYVCTLCTPNMTNAASALCQLYVSNYPARTNLVHLITVCLARLSHGHDLINSTVAANREYADIHILLYYIVYYMVYGIRGCVGCRLSKLESSLLPISQEISTCSSLRLLLLLWLLVLVLV